ncbi:MAG: Flp pilus assembly protein CpaB [Desulfobacterales bacterium]|nr:Flp pilus assembly protein CpaB [Desulfobacterales bacterium]MDD4073883.1 Flp pilus assembly protein CpaB [Desulfobacterales bacterium]MDD4391124.1 Flp pilus assembly protein CpaB [Desulfobacterales bacterium]
MGNWKASVPILLALIIATSGSFFLYNWIQTTTAPRETVEVATQAVPVAVAASDLPWGTRLEPDMVKMVPFLKESLPNGYFSDVNSLKGRVLLASMKTKEAISEHHLAPVSVTIGGVSAVLKPGKRAIAVKGDKIIGISGFINPANRIDVLVTLTEPVTNTEKTKLVLENVLVLATGTQIQKNDKGEPAPVDVYTLEVSPEESETLALAAARGKLQFALRNSTDSESVLTRGATIPTTLASLYMAPQKPLKKPVRRHSRTTTVETIKGSELSKTKLKL